jgi:LacI family transcriptional regulator
MSKLLVNNRFRDTKTLLLRQMPDRRYFRGISRYLHERRDWSVLSLPYDQPDFAPQDVPQWADAVVMDLWSPRLQALAKHFRVPVVNLIQTVEPLPYSTVSVDNHEVGRLAFEHFRSMGLRYFAYLDWKAVDGPVRRQGFEQAAADAGMSDRLIEVPSLLSRSDWSQDVTRQADVFRQLPRPIGILCFADWLATLALQALHIADIAVPEEVAVMGVDDDEIICETALPSLTSVNTHTDRVGYEAARLAIDLAEGVSVTAQQIAELVIISRRGLDKKFIRELGHTVAEEIGRQRMRRVLQLLQSTDLKMVEIATRTGFRTISHLSRAVSQHTGRSPGAYRQWARP